MGYESVPGMYRKNSAQILLAKRNWACPRQRGPGELLVKGEISLGIDSKFGNDVRKGGGTCEDAEDPQGPCVRQHHGDEYI